MTVRRATSRWFQTYSVCHVDVAVECPEQRQAGKVGELWQCLFATTKRHLSAGGPSVFVWFQAVDYHRGVPVPGKEVFRSAGLGVFHTDDGFYLQCGSSWLDLDLLNSQAVGVLDEEFWHRPLRDQREFFLLSMLMLLRRHGLYGLHASAVAREGTGFLIAGGSGCGKTTLSVALVRSGWSYLSDDALMLRKNGEESIEALALRRGFSCPPDMIERFPELGSCPAGASFLDDGKRLVNPESVYPGRFEPQCHPQVLLFPMIASGRKSELVLMNETDALTSLIQQSPGIMTDRCSAGKQLEVLGLLLRQAVSYQLVLGSDVYQEPTAVSDLLWEARRV